MLTDEHLVATECSRQIICACFGALHDEREEKIAITGKRLRLSRARILRTIFSYDFLTFLSTDLRYYTSSFLMTTLCKRDVFHMHFVLRTIYE